MLQQGWHLVKIPLLHSHIIWAMYILGLFSSWGTSRICPAWSPSVHQLAPALSPIWGPRPKPRHPVEVVYSPNDSCSHFTQRLFPPKLPQQHTHGLFLTIHSTSFISIIHYIYTNNYTFYLHDIFTLSLRIFIAGWLPSVPCVWYTFNHRCPPMDTAGILYYLVLSVYRARNPVLSLWVRKNWFRKVTGVRISGTQPLIKCSNVKKSKLNRIFSDVTI
jgi:hypothetical protein